MTLAVGFFDGVHLGHREILARADAALTFRSHPLSLLAPERAPALLSSADERAALVRSALGGSSHSANRAAADSSSDANCVAREVRMLDFTPAFAAQSPADFVAWLRSEWPALDRVRCGADWKFGAGGRGDADVLRSFGIAVDVVPPVEWNGARISSSRIRAALAEDDVAAANAMLGREFSAAGVVVRGKGEGRKLGFPTVNLRCSLDRRLLPLGAYAVRAAPFGVGVANWGVAPTMGSAAWKEPTLEIHFPNAAPDSPWPDVGATFAVSFVRFIRPERKFVSLDSLRAQIADDVSESGKVE